MKSLDHIRVWPGLPLRNALPSVNPVAPGPLRNTPGLDDPGKA